jgi:hypothetical protein
MYHKLTYNFFSLLMSHLSIISSILSFITFLLSLVIAKVMIFYIFIFKDHYNALSALFY